MVNVNIKNKNTFLFIDLRGEPGHLADCEEVEFGIDPTFKGHKGMVAAARYHIEQIHPIFNFCSKMSLFS